MTELLTKYTTWPVLYDWVTIVAASVVLLVFVYKYGQRHPGLRSALIVQTLILLLYIAWSSRFSAAAGSQVLGTMGQIYILAPVVSFAVLTLFNAHLNFKTGKVDEG